VSGVGHKFVYANRCVVSGNLFVVETRFDEDHSERANSTCVLLRPRHSDVLARFDRAVVDAVAVDRGHVVILDDGAAWFIDGKAVLPLDTVPPMPSRATDTAGGETAVLHADGTVGFRRVRTAVPGSPTSLCVRADGRGVFLGSQTLGLLLLENGVVTRVRPSLRAHRLSRSGDDVVIVSDLFVSIWSGADGEFMTIDLSSTIRAVEAA
jgi:hypothetical protein